MKTSIISLFEGILPSIPKQIIKRDFLTIPRLTSYYNFQNDEQFNVVSSIFSDQLETKLKVKTNLKTKLQSIVVKKRKQNDEIVNFDHLSHKIKHLIERQEELNASKEIEEVSIRNKPKYCKIGKILIFL